MAKKNGIFWITFMVLAVFLLSACSKKKSTKPEPPDTWTILGYFDGNNGEDFGDTIRVHYRLDTLSHVIQDVQEMEQVGSTENVRIIVMLGSFKIEGNCNYYFIEKQLGQPPTDSIRSRLLKSLDKPDMSNPDILKEFIEYGVENYPADHYVLIINDGGSGWKGVCSDQLNGDRDEMTLLELSSALSPHFDIIFFNAPSMSMVEVAYQLKEEADYIVASQYHDLEKNVLASSVWLQRLINDPNMKSISLARNIGTAIYETATSKGEEVSISVIDPSKVDVLVSKIGDFGSVLLTQTGEHSKELADARQTEITSSQFHFTTYYFDLKKFCRNIQSSPNLDLVVKSAAQMVEDANDAAVVTLLTTQEELGYGGLCIHFPFKPEDFDSTEYVQLDFAVSEWEWHIFLSEFIKAYMDANTGSLRVSSIPTGAKIFLNGEDTGFVTDTTIHGIPPGLYTVLLKKEGYKDKGFGLVSIGAGSFRELHAELQPLPPSEESLFESWNQR